jgi:hypothetical protein
MCWQEGVLRRPLVRGSFCCVWLVHQEVIIQVVVGGACECVRMGRLSDAPHNPQDLGVARGCYTLGIVYNRVKGGQC